LKRTFQAVSPLESASTIHRSTSVTLPQPFAQALSSGFFSLLRQKSTQKVGNKSLKFLLE
jgi:hypothetical protein